MNLDSLRTALRLEAETEAANRLTQVDEACKRRLAEAHATARELTDQGRHEGARLAERDALRRRAVAKRRARELRLAAQRELIDELRMRSKGAALGLRKDPRYEELLDRLSKLAKSQLGADAEVEADQPELGGVVAYAGSRSVDYTLPALVDRAIAELDGQLETLWQ
jgi:vacuolar-type H+-ATPase subunit E/Vma4